jgi:hypothetical protein
MQSQIDIFNRIKRVCLWNYVEIYIGCWSRNLKQNGLPGKSSPPNELSFLVSPVIENKLNQNGRKKARAPG